MKQKYANLAEALAATSNGQYKIGAVHVKGRDVVGLATNTYKTHPAQANWARKAGHPKKISLHAECRALLQSGVVGGSVYVARVNRNGMRRMAKPCPVCQLALEERGVEEVYFTNRIGEWEQL